MSDNGHITLNHGSGGKLTRELIDSLFMRHFDNETLRAHSDSAVLQTGTGNLAFTTDGYVVNPLFFPGGNIGTLAVCGTVNDLAVSGAVPRWLTASFIIEEGFAREKLQEAVAAMAARASEAGVRIVAGDTKVVNRGMCDGLFITTSGIGELESRYQSISTGTTIEPGDAVLINGAIADHGMAILTAREDVKLAAPIESDCAPLAGLIAGALDCSDGVRFMRDATRGGLATVLCELAEQRSLGIEIDEQAVPVHEPVRGVCDMFGFDPMYVANEGKVVMVVDCSDAPRVLEALRSHPYGREAARIGTVVADHPGRVEAETEIGGRRILDILAGDQLPRIC